MNEFYVRNVLEAALLAAGKPLQLAELSQLFDETTRPKTADIRATLDALATEYSSRGVEVKETAAGFRIQVRREFSPEVSRLWPERPARYSRALLETLALIAYRQPITRAEIEAVRGVAVNPNIIKTVIERNWVRVVGHRDVPGRPELLGTTREFLDYFGLRTLDELPPLAEIKTLGDYNPQLELSGGATQAIEGPADEMLNGAGDAEGANIDVVGVAVAGLLTSEGTALDVVSLGPNDSASEAATAAADSPGSGTVGAATDSEGATVLESSAGAEVQQGRAVESESEAERTLTASEAVEPHASAEADDTEASSNTDASESLDAIDDSADEEADEDELSADGHGSRELVAGPRDLDG